jgi:hypothetical protein
MIKLSDLKENVSSSSEQSMIGGLTWDSGNDPVGLIYKTYRWIKVDKRVDVWFNVKYTSANASPTTGVVFSLPDDCPVPGLWSAGIADEVITFGNGKTFVSSLGTERIDHISKVALYQNAGNYYVSVGTYGRLQNAFGNFLPQPIYPIGFNAHITYFTDI